jgi:uncharacterized protein (TIGR02266 family)
VTGYNDAIGVNRSARASVAPRASLEVTLVLDLDSESNFYAGFTENLSECGVFVATFAPLSIGSSVDVVIVLGSREPIRARGTVRWQRSYSESNETTPGMGIRFDHLSAEHTARIHEFSLRRAPIFFDDESTDTVQRTTLRP